MKMYFLLKMGIFHGYVCLPECNWILRISELDIKLVQSVIGNHKPEITSETSAEFLYYVRVLFWGSLCNHDPHITSGKPKNDTTA